MLKVCCTLLCHKVIIWHLMQFSICFISKECYALVAEDMLCLMSCYQLSCTEMHIRLVLGWIDWIVFGGLLSLSWSYVSLSWVWLLDSFSVIFLKVAFLIWIFCKIFYYHGFITFAADCLWKPLSEVTKQFHCVPYSKATSLDGTFPPAWIGYGNAYAAQEEGDQAMSAYRTAARLFPG